MADVSPAETREADPKPMPKSNFLARVAVSVTALLLVTGLTACGRKAEPTVATEAPAKPPEVSPVGIPVGVNTAPPEAPKPAAKGRFLLDPLL